MKGVLNRKHTLHVQPVQPAGARARWLSPFQIATTRVLTFVRLTKLCHKSLCRLAVTCCRLSFQKSHEPQQIEFLLLWRHEHFNNDFCVLSASAQPEGGERNREGDRGWLLPAVAFVWVLPLWRRRNSEASDETVSGRNKQR